MGFGVETARRLALRRAEEAGAVAPEVEVSCAEEKGTANPAFGSEIFLETRIRATAVGRAMMNDER